MLELDLVTSIRIIFGILGLIAGIVSAIFAYKIIKEPQLVLTHFQLNPDKMIIDSKILLGNYIIMFLGFSVYTLGRIIDEAALVNLGRITGIIYAILMIIVFARWIKRS